ncbi:MAG: NADH-quinone oxidoreductase subunit L [Firmicutes bacterium]|nr:NADH-quinone oxidoreductase subunit L [Bacillota bacterium]
MAETFLWMLILIPAVLGGALLLIPTQTRYWQGVLGTLAAAFLFYPLIQLWNQKVNLMVPWAGFGVDFQLRFYGLSRFIVAGIIGITFLVILYSLKFRLDQPKNNQFYGFLLLSEAMAIGAVLSNNLVVMLFFWEALLISLFVLITSGNERAYKTALKAFTIVGLSDLCLMLGIGIVGAQAHTLVISDIHLSTAGINGVAFILMLVGAMAKAGALPFHTWIPDAATSAPLPFMALFPGALEKLLGIYLVARIALDLFSLTVGMKILVMTLGAITIIIAVMMALIQKDYKRLLSYHAISQVGYMILGIGTGNPLGIAGGLFHMVNNAIFKSCLFLTGGAVEKQTGTTDIRDLGGLWKQMPFTFFCFFIAALSISGVPPFNGFVSKEMIFEGVLDLGRNYTIFFTVASLGALFTAASFLKLGHASFFGQSDPERKTVKEVHWTMVLPMLVLAVGCIVFGLGFKMPLTHLIEPSLAGSLSETMLKKIHFAFAITPLFWWTVAILFVAVVNHIIGVKLSGKPSGASEHIHHYPGLHTLYDLAEKRVFDPYVQGKKVFGYFAQGLFAVDRAVDWVYQRMAPGIAEFIAKAHRIHKGRYDTYLSWSLGGLLAIILYLALL